MTLLAHKDADGGVQTLRDHLHNAGDLAESYESEFSQIPRMAALLHDVGKVAQQFQTYLISGKGRRGEIPHARQGAFVVNDLPISNSAAEIVKEILELVIAKHHGELPDCINEIGDEAFLTGFTEADKQNPKYAYGEIKQGLHDLDLDLQDTFQQAEKDVFDFAGRTKLLKLSKDSRYFYSGLLVKYVYSRLIDADRTDTAYFETKEQYHPIKADWSELIRRLDESMKSFDSTSEINGDPLNGNRPRTTSEGLGEVSDVALKRKIRNRLQDAGETIFVQSDDRSDDGAKSLSDRFNTYLKTLPKEEQKQKNLVFQKVCEQWLDVRAFGQVFAFKKAKDVDEVSLGVRGPVSIQAAFSVEPIAIDDVQITKSVNSETTDTGKKSSDTMGMKYRVSGRAVYATYGSISPQLAEKTGFTAEDAEKIKEALVTLFENDESSARPAGSMEVLDVVWFTHNSKSGQYSSAKVHRSVSVNVDGTVAVNGSSIPDLRYEVIEGR